MSRTFIAQDRRSFIRTFAALGASVAIPSSADALQSSSPSPSTIPIPPAPVGSASTTEGEWDLYSRGTEGQTDFIQDIAYTRSQSTVGKGNDIAVVADTICIVGQVQLPSKNVFLFARQITFESGASIDTSGGTGTPYLSRALDGQFPGDNGRPGDQKAGDAPNQSAGAIGGKNFAFCRCSPW